jgi:hypothetical protein
VTKQGSSGPVRIGGLAVHGPVAPFDFDAVPRRDDRVSSGGLDLGVAWTGSRAMTSAASAVLRPVKWQAVEPSFSAVTSTSGPPGRPVTLKPSHAPLDKQQNVPSGATRHPH